MSESEKNIKNQISEILDSITGSSEETDTYIDKIMSIVNKDKYKNFNLAVEMDTIFDDILVYDFNLPDELKKKCIDELIELWNEFYNQTTKNYTTMAENVMEEKNKIIEKLKVEVKSLGRDLHFSLKEVDQLKTKLKMIKILIENEDY